MCVFVEEINGVESRDVPPPLFLVKSSNSAFSQRGKQKQVWLIHLTISIFKTVNPTKISRPQFALHSLNINQKQEQDYLRRSFQLVPSQNVDWTKLSRSHPFIPPSARCTKNSPWTRCANEHSLTRLPQISITADRQEGDHLHPYHSQIANWTHCIDAQCHHNIVFSTSETQQRQARPDPIQLSLGQAIL